MTLLSFRNVTCLITYSLSLSSSRIGDLLFIRTFSCIEGNCYFCPANLQSPLDDTQHCMAIEQLSHPLRSPIDKWHSIHNPPLLMSMMWHFCRCCHSLPLAVVSFYAQYVEAAVDHLHQC